MTNKRPAPFYLPNGTSIDIQTTVDYVDLYIEGVRASLEGKDISYVKHGGN